MGLYILSPGLKNDNFSSRKVNKRAQADVEKVNKRERGGREREQIIMSLFKVMSWLLVNY